MITASTDGKLVTIDLDKLPKGYDNFRLDMMPSVLNRDRTEDTNIQISCTTSIGDIMLLQDKKKSGVQDG